MGENLQLIQNDRKKRIIFVTLQAVIQLTRMHMNSKDDQ